MTGTPDRAPGGPAAGDPLTAAERDELERLRAEVARTRGGDGGAAPGPSAAGRWRGRARAATSAVLIVLGCALAPVSVAAAWLRGEVTDTDRYVATVAPLADDPVIQQAVAARLTDVVFSHVDVRGLARQGIDRLRDRGALPGDLAGQLDALTGPLAEGVRGFAGDRIGELTRSDAFAVAWVTAHREVHRQLVAALTGRQDGALTVFGDTVSVNLAPLLVQVKKRLVGAGFELAARLPAVDASFPVFRSEQVQRWQRAFAVLDAIGVWLAPLLLVTAAVGVRLARDRRRALLGTALGVAAAMLVAATALAVARTAYLGAVPPSTLPPAAAAVLFDTVVRFLRESLRAAFLTALVVAAGAYLTGPAWAAVAVRGAAVRGFVAARRPLHAPQLGAVSRWVAPRARLLRAAAASLGLGVVLLDRYRTPQLVLQVTAGVLVALAVIGFLAVEPAARRPGPAAA